MINSAEIRKPALPPLRTRPIFSCSRMVRNKNFKSAGTKLSVRFTGFQYSPIADEPGILQLNKIGFVFEITLMLES